MNLIGQLQRQLELATAAEANATAGGRCSQVERVHKEILLQRLAKLEESEAVLEDERRKLEAEQQAVAADEARAAQHAPPSQKLLRHTSPSREHEQPIAPLCL